MLMNFSKEDRELLQEAGAVVDIPRDTKPEVARKLYEHAKALLTTLRGLAPVIEGRSASRTKRITKADVRAAFAVAPELPLEEISRFKRLGYSDDVVLALRGAAIGRTILQGFAFEAEPLRSEDGGAVSDPQQSLRDAVTFHRNCASKAKSMNACVAHHKAADEAERKLKG
jgi:hypothetical protein